MGRVATLAAVSPHAALRPSEQSFYLQADQDASFLTVHRAAAPPDTAVLLCPPFGWQEVSSYRPRRIWAQMLAQAGYSTARLTLPSTGDSGGRVHDPGRLAAWSSAIDAAAAWLRRDSQATRVVAIGMELGGLLAYRCATLGAEIDDLVLWSVSSKGRALVRQLRALSRLEAGQFFEGLPHPPPLPDGEIEAAGFRLSAETVRDLEQIDLAALQLADAGRRRVLLLERDGIAVDSRLRDRLTGMGAAVTTAPGDGYDQMTSHPQYAEPATGVLAVVVAWLGERAAPLPAPTDGTGPGPDPPASGAHRPRLDGPSEEGWTECPVSFTHAGVTLAGILTLPRDPSSDGLCAVLLDTGAVRRIGPSRMWVQTARRWAQRGVPVLRLDVEGIGDAAGPAVAYPSDAPFHRPELILQVRAALDFLQARGAGERFVLAGLCSGAYWAFHGCLDDERVCAAAMINCRVLAWDEDLAPARYVRTLLTQRPSVARIRRVATAALLMEVVRWMVGVPRRWIRRLASPTARAGAGATDRLLAQLLDTGKRALFLFSEREPLHDELRRSGWLATLQTSPAVTVEHLAVIDHTLRPSWAQEEAQQALDRALARELDVAGTISSPSAPA